MRAALSALSWAALLLCVASSRVQLVNNGYSGMVVGIDDRVNVLQCRQVLGNVKVSPASHRAVNVQMYVYSLLDHSPMQMHEYDDSIGRKTQ